jgi:hypothetical protein
MEPYTATNASCRATVLQYLSGWTKETRRLGYIAGVYAQLSSGARNLAQSYTSTSYARPDAPWIARYDGVSALSGWAGVPTVTGRCTSGPSSTATATTKPTAG